MLELLPIIIWSTIFLINQRITVNKHTLPQGETPIGVQKELAPPGEP